MWQVHKCHPFRLPFTSCIQRHSDSGKLSLCLFSSHESLVTVDVLTFPFGHWITISLASRAMKENHGVHGVFPGGETGGRMRKEAGCCGSPKQRWELTLAVWMWRTEVCGSLQLYQKLSGTSAQETEREGRELWLMLSINVCGCTVTATPLTC